MNRWRNLMFDRRFERSDAELRLGKQLGVDGPRHIENVDATQQEIVEQFHGTNAAVFVVVVKIEIDVARNPATDNRLGESQTDSHARRYRSVKDHLVDVGTAAVHFLVVEAKNPLKTSAILPLSRKPRMPYVS